MNSLKKYFEGDGTNAFHVNMILILCVLALIRFVYLQFLWDLPPEYGTLRVFEVFALATISDFFVLLVLLAISYVTAWAAKQKLRHDYLFIFLTMSFLLSHIGDLEAYRIFLTRISVYDLAYIWSIEAWSSILFANYYLFALGLFSVVFVIILLSNHKCKIRIWEIRYVRVVMLFCYIGAIVIGLVWSYQVITVPDDEYRIGYELGSNVVLYNMRNIMKDKDGNEGWDEGDVQGVVDYINASVVTMANDNIGRERVYDADAGARLKRIILVVMESWSSVDSFVFKGYLNIMPELDDLVKDGSYFTNFHANSASSGNSSVAVISGLLPYMKRNRLLLRDMPFLEYPSLVEEVQKHGFGSIYLHNGSLLFEKQLSYLRKVGYDLILDRKQFDKTARRFGWGPSDKELFEKALKILESERERRTFITIASVTNHAPFILPDERFRLYKEDYKNTTLYSDAAFAWFYRELGKRGLLGESLLIVTGDHVRHNKPEFSGNEAIDYDTRIPLVIWEPFGKMKKGEDSRLASQIDIGPTIMDLLGVKNNWFFLGRSLLEAENKDNVVITRDYNRKIIIRRSNERIDLFYDGTVNRYEVHGEKGYTLVPMPEKELGRWFEKTIDFIKSYNRMLENNKMRSIILKEDLSRSIKR